MKQDWSVLLYLCDFLCSDLDGVLLFTAVIQRGPVHVFVMQIGQLLHLLTNTCDFILNLQEQDFTVHSVDDG